jgi:hypothetical protein
VEGKDKDEKAYMNMTSRMFAQEMRLLGAGVQCSVIDPPFIQEAYCISGSETRLVI